MPYCSVLTCRNHSGKTNVSNSGVSYHKFPTEVKYKEQWICATGRYDWFPLKSNTICCIHFEDRLFLSGKKRRLRYDAISTLNLHPALDSKTTQVNYNIVSSNEDGIPDTPRKRKLRLELENSQILIKRQKLMIKRLRERNRRNVKKIAKLDKILEDLRQTYNVQDEDITLLRSTKISTGELSITKTHKRVKKFSPAIRSFALTLHFYSPKAYSYVRSTFNTCLPHPRTLKKWYTNIDAKAGFTAEALKALKLKKNLTNHQLVGNLVVDEMAIRKRVEWDGTKFHGYVDIGNNINSDCLKEAKEAYVLLVTAINGDWKIPVGYFLVDGINGEQRANLVRQCLQLIHDTGVQIVSLTCDGCPANLTMLRKLGCQLDISNMKPYFEHPTTKAPVFAFLDACHMIKLVRTAFQFYETLVDGQNRPVKWSVIQNLLEIQEKEFLHLANRLTREHIDFQNKKMKVKLATQLFSNSVADAIEFCENTLNLDYFFNTQGTTSFLRTMNDLFDFFNSKNMLQFDSKKPLNPKNKIEKFEFLEQIKIYFKTLSLPNGTPLVKSDRKVGFIGFLLCIESAQGLYEDLVERRKILKYIPFFKLSQDHLELLFCLIRSHGGSNNNPTARQFQSIHRKLLIHMELKEDRNGNCIPLENISILTCSSGLQKINLTSPSDTELVIDDEAGDSIFDDPEEELNIEILSEFSKQVISYVAGFIVRYLSRKLKCSTCVDSLFAKEEIPAHNFLKIKDKGGIVYPSESVILLCRAVETVIKTRLMINSTIKSKDNKMYLIANALKLCIGMDIFKCLNDHQFDQDPLYSHVVNLKKAIMEKYIDIRLHYLTKRTSNKLSFRHLYNKQILFSGQ